MTIASGLSAFSNRLSKSSSLGKLISWLGSVAILAGSLLLTAVKFGFSKTKVWGPTMAVEGVATVTEVVTVGIEFSVVEVVS